MFWDSVSSGGAGNTVFFAGRDVHNAEQNKTVSGKSALVNVRVVRVREFGTDDKG